MLPALIAETVDLTTTTSDAAANAAAGGILAALAGFWLILILIAVVFFIFWILMLVHAVKTDEATFKAIGSGEKTLWLIVLGVSLFVGFSWLATIIYYFVIYRKAKKMGAPAPQAPADAPKA